MRVLLSVFPFLSCVVLLLLLFVVVPPCSVSAHNWLTSPSRANHVNDRGEGDFNGFTNPPCPTKQGRVHTQVGPGQKFQVEWASGHGYGSFTYLVLLRAVDEYRMVEQTREVLDEYIKDAPAGSADMPNDKAYHVTDNGPSNDASLAQDITATFQRPALFRRMNNPRIYTKTAEATKNDRRVRYTNAKYPWIISVHKFALNEDRSEQMDGALMAVPADLPSGQYIVQYQWSGYYDCVDVNVLSEASIDIYGSTPVSSIKEMDKLNHCLYTPTLKNYKAFDNECFELADGDTIDTCANACFFNSFQYDYCDAVVVSPVRLNRDVVKFGGTFAGGSHLPPSCANALAKLKGNPDTAQVCYTVKAGDTPIVGPPLKIVSDPEDPVFYSTCYQKRSSWSFKQACPACKPPAPPADFRFGERCTTCADMNRNFFTKAVPRWTTTTLCEHCDSRLG